MWYLSGVHGSKEKKFRGGVILRRNVHIPPVSKDWAIDNEGQFICHEASLFGRWPFQIANSITFWTISTSKMLPYGNCPRKPPFASRSSVDEGVLAAEETRFCCRCRCVSRLFIFTFCKRGSCLDERNTNLGTIDWNKPEKIRKIFRNPSSSKIWTPQKLGDYQGCGILELRFG